MAVDITNLVPMGEGNGFTHYRYDTLDTHASVDTAEYFNNSDETVIFRVGDLVDVIVWATAIRTGTISTYGRHIVNSVSAAGIVDLTDVTVGVVTDTD